LRPVKRIATGDRGDRPRAIPPAPGAMLTSPCPNKKGPTMPNTGKSLFSPFQQTIDTFWNQPVTQWQRFFNPQIIFNSNPEDEELEYHVLERVGSYGSQLSTLIAMIDLLLPTIEMGDLTPAQKAVVNEFKNLSAESRLAVAEYRGELGPDDAERIAAFLKKSQTHFPVTFAFLKGKFEELTQPEPVEQAQDMP
jgi:hypothetical protein